MARFSITIESKGGPELKRGFNKITAEIGNLRPHFEAVKSNIFEITKEVLSSEGGKGADGRFEPLSSPYEEIKAVNYPGKPILQASGTMFESLTSETGDTIFNVTRDGLEFGSSLPQFGFHRTGTKRMPKRDPLSFTRNQKERVFRRFRKSLLAEIQKSGLEVKE